MPKKAPVCTGATHKAVLREAERQQATGYGLAKTTGLGLFTIQRFLAGEGSPTIDTVERIAKALGLTIEVRKA